LDSFSPPSATFNNLNANQTANFLVGSAGTFTFILGQVTDSGGHPVSGVTMTLSGSQGGPATATTDGSGNYSFSVAAGGSYTVTPSLSGHAFTPPSKTFSNLSGNQTASFIASPLATISGQVTLSGGGPYGGATITLSGSQSASATTDGSGNYTFSVPTGGSYTVTPAGRIHLQSAQPDLQQSE
jgi:hypothetical protein